MTKKGYKHIWLSVVCAIGTFLSFHSCDSREDYFLLKCDEPEVTVNESQGDGVDTMYGRRYIVLNIGWGETKTVAFDFKDPYGYEIQDYEFEIKGGRGGEYINPDYAKCDIEKTKMPFNEKFVDIKINKETKTIEITDITTSPLDHLNSDGEMHTWEIHNLLIYAKNKLGKSGYASVQLRFRGNQMPKPEIQIEEGSNPMEKLISVIGNDPENEEIDKYEYCIDGKPIWEHQSGYEIDGMEKYYIRDAYVAHKSGKAAYNGTYITATKLSSIKHIFQEQGAHTIYVRCKDKWGLWSEWTKKEINIRK